MLTQSCSIGGNYFHAHGRTIYREPCTQPPAIRYRSPGFVEGHWAYRCTEHAQWLLAPGLTIEPLASDQAAPATRPNRTGGAE